jgi:hypothetical protein
MRDREPDFIELGPDETVENFRIVKRRRRGRSASVVLAWLLGAWAAFWFAWYLLPGVEIHAASDGRWESISLDWSRNLFGRSRGHE